MNSIKLLINKIIIMKNFKEYRCGYCDKSFLNCLELIFHEKKLHKYHHEKTCETCAFLENETIELMYSKKLSYKACLLNLPMHPTRLRTQCKKYVSYEYESDPNVIEPAYEIYDRKKQGEEAVSRLNLKESIAVDPEN